MKWIIGLFLAVWISVSAISPAHAQASNSLLKQDRDTAGPQPMTETELSQLNDPLFNLVLKNHPDATRLSEIENFLQSNTSQRETFVVDEQIVDPSLGQSRRAVLTFDGTNQGQFLSPNVMFSTSFNSSEFSEQPNFLEAWGWDDQGGRYNYYRLDSIGTGTPSWKFRGSSEEADTLSAQARQGTCMQCHINGGPVMKELFLPWNNWNSRFSEATYLKRGRPGSWPVATDSHLVNNRLGDAYGLQGEITSAIEVFNGKRIDALTRTSGTTVEEVTDAKRLLNPLFETTEFNLISSRQNTRLHPFSSSTALPTANVVIPDSFFLNSELIGGENLQITESREFSNSAQVSPADYERLIEDFGVKLAGQQPGDANFAWFVPEASFIDNDLIEELMRRNIVPQQFAAAVLAVDLETPIFSADRKRLLNVIPDRFSVNPSNDLIAKTIANLEALDPASDSPEGQFLQNLQNPNSVENLTNKVKDYLQREKDLLSNPSTKFTELTRLNGLAIASRQAVLRDPILHELDETRGKLLPLP